MSVAFVQSVAFVTAAAATLSSGSFTPTAGDELVAFGVDINHSAGVLVFTDSVVGAAGWSNPSPPNGFTDAGNDVYAIGVNLACAGGSQTINLASSGATRLLLAGFEYSGIQSYSSVNGVTRASPGTGTGAITGTSQLVPTGDVLLAFCLDISAINSSLTGSPSGTSRGVGQINGSSFAFTEYAGAGSNITPSFTTTVGTNNYVVLQIELSAISPLMGQACL